MNVLIVDDEPSVRDSIARALRLDGHDVRVACDGAEGIAMLEASGSDVVILDVMMPVLDGLESCRRLRESGDHTPVLMLTARSSVADRVDGLGVGADDYLAKPFALEELKARLTALHRRAVSPATGADERVLRYRGLSLDLDTRECRRDGYRVEPLTRLESELLELFLRSPEKVVPQRRIVDDVFGGGATDSAAVHVFALRRKLEAGSDYRLIWSIRDVGYELRSPDAANRLRPDGPPNLGPFERTERVE